MAIKFIGEVGPFKAYRAGGVVIIKRDGELFVNFRKRDGLGFNAPLAYCANVLAAEAERAEELAAFAADRRANVAAYLAARAARVAAEPQFAF